MKITNLLIVIGLTALIMYNSYGAWKWITSDNLEALGITLVFDLLAVFAWIERVKWLAISASTVIGLAALLHLSSNVVTKLDSMDNTAYMQKANNDLREIGKGAAKYGNHQAVNQAIEGIKKTTVTKKEGSYTYIKLVVSTVTQALMILTSIWGQIYFSIQLKQGGEVVKGTEQKQKRNTNRDSSIKDIAGALVRDINKYIEGNGLSTSKMMSLLHEPRNTATRLNETKKLGKGLSIVKMQEIRSRLDELVASS